MTTAVNGLIREQSYHGLGPRAERKDTRNGSSRARGRNGSPSRAPDRPIVPGDATLSFVPEEGDAGWRCDMAWRGIAVAMIIIAACLIALGFTADFLVDWLWFSAVRYPDVFWTILGAKVALFLAVFAASAILLWLNGSLALSARRATEASPCGRLSLGTNGRSNINRAVGALVPAPPLAFPRRGRRPRPRGPRCPGRD